MVISHSNVERVTVKILFMDKEEAHLLSFSIFFFYLTTSELFTAVVSPASSLCPISYHPVSALLPCCILHLLLGVPAVVPSLFFSTLHHCAGVIYISFYLEYLLVCINIYIFIENCKCPSQTNKSKTETDTWSIREIAMTAKPSKAKADQEEFRQGRPDTRLSSASQTQDRAYGLLRATAIPYYYTATNKELIDFLFRCIYSLLTGKNSPAKLSRIHVVPLCSGGEL